MCADFIDGRHLGVVSSADISQPADGTHMLRSVLRHGREALLSGRRWHTRRMQIAKSQNPHLVNPNDEKASPPAYNMQHGVRLSSPNQSTAVLRMILRLEVQ